MSKRYIYISHQCTCASLCVYWRILVGGSLTSKFCLSKLYIYISTYAMLVNTEVTIYACTCTCMCVCMCYNGRALTSKQCCGILAYTLLLCIICVCVCIKHILEYVSGQPWPVSEIGIVELLAKFMNEYGLVVARSISPVVSGRIMIQVLNPSPAQVVINKKVNVGTVEPVQEYCCKVSSAGLQEERNNILEERIETMLGEAVTLGDKERQQAKELLRDFKDIIALSDDDLGRTTIIYALGIRSPSANVQDAYHFISIHKCISY